MFRNSRTSKRVYYNTVCTVLYHCKDTSQFKQMSVKCDLFKCNTVINITAKFSRNSAAQILHFEWTSELPRVQFSGGDDELRCCLPAMTGP